MLSGISSALPDAFRFSGEGGWNTAMKILLLAINAKYIHTNPAIYSLRRYAIHACGPEYADCFAEHIFLREYTINHEKDAVLRGIYELRPGVLCISCYLWNIRMVRAVVSDYKKIDPAVKIYLGGPEVTYHAEQVLKELPEADGVMVGEGEATFYELASYWLRRPEPQQADSGFFAESSLSDKPGTAVYRSASAPPVSLAGICGLVFRDEAGRLRRNPPREPLDFAALPFPYEDMGDLGGFEHRIIYYETSRGCPFSCCYCLSSVEKTLKFRNWTSIQRELKIFLDAGVAQVKFVDRTFNCRKEHAMRIWQYLKEHDNGVTNFHFEIAADLLDEEEIVLLASLRPGQVQLEIGVQSTNPETIRAIRRRMDLERVADAVTRVRAARNIHQHLDLIAGLPYEDYKSFGRSFDAVYRMRPDQLQLGFLKVLRGSAMETMAAEHGVLWQQEPPYEVLATRYLPYQDLLRLKDIEELVERYYNSGQFAMSISYLEHCFDSPFVMYEALAAYWRKLGLFDSRRGRLEYYELLYDFFRGSEMAEHSRLGEIGNSCFDLLQLEMSNPETLNLGLQKAELPDPKTLSPELSISGWKEAAVFAGAERADRNACFAELLLFDLYSREKLKSRPRFLPDYGLGKDEVQRFLSAAGVGRERSGQCYILRFRFDLREAAASGKIRRKECLCLFDYSCRDALSGACRARWLSSEA